MNLETNNTLVYSGSVVLRNTLLNLFSRLLLVPVGIVAIQFILSGMGIERYGLFSFSWTIINYLAILDFGISTAITKYMAEDLGLRQGRNAASIFWTAFTVLLVLGLVVAALFVLLTPYLVEQVMNIPSYLVPEGKRMFWLLAVSVPFIFMNNSLRGALEAGQRFDIVNLIRTPYTAGIYLIPLIGYIIGWRIDTITAFLLLVILIAFLAYAYGNFRVYPGLFKSAGLRLEKPGLLLKFSGWVAIANGMSAVFIYAERVLITSALSIAVLAYYTVPYDALTRLWIIPTSITAVLLPVFSESGSKAPDNQLDRRMVSFATRFMFITLGPLAIMLSVFAKNVLEVWIGPEFAESSGLVASLLVIGVFINSFGRIPATLLYGKGRPDIPAKLYIVELPLYLIVAIGSIRLWGINGAALAWTLRVSTDSILLIWVAIRRSFLQKQEVINGPNTKSVLNLLLLGLAFLVAGTQVGRDHLLLLMLSTSVIIGTYLVLSWLFIFDEQEREYVIKVTQRLIPIRKPAP